MTKSKKKIIYLAGLFDGEGCITIGKHQLRGYRKKPEFSLTLSISNTHKEVLEWVKENFKGQVYKKSLTLSKKEKLRRKQVYWWRASNPDIREILMKIVPYVKIKKEQVKVALEFIKTKKPFPYGIKYKLSDNERKKREKLWKIMRQLNHRGPPNYMPCYSCKNGKYRLGSSKCMYKSKASCERALKAYQAKKHSKRSKK